MPVVFRSTWLSLEVARLSARGASQPLPMHSDPNLLYQMIYGCIAASNSIFTLLRSFLFAYGGIKAAKVLHSALLNGIFTFFRQGNKMNSNKELFNCLQIQGALMTWSTY